MRLKPAQRNKLSDFFNMVAAAWFSAGVISPVFIKPNNSNQAIVLGFLAIGATSWFLYWSVTLVRKVRL